MLKQGLYRAYYVLRGCGQMLGMFFEWIQTVLILAGYVSGSAAFPKPLTAEEEKKYLAEHAEGSESA